MFDSPFDFFALVIAIVAFIFARKAMNQVAALRAQLDVMQRLATAAAAERSVPPPLPQPDRGFEETIGTRWVVWIGGLTLALGGFFMVRYSIEAGLLGPGVRTILGGLFALALLAAGEWTRRQESISTIEALPIANIPAILTAAGTAVAFATVYAAYALYGFLVPATAFILLGLVALGTLAAALLHGPALAGLGIAGGSLWINYNWNGKSTLLWIIDTGYFMIGCALAGWIIGAM